MRKLILALVLAGLVFAGAAGAGTVVGIGQQQAGRTIRLHPGDTLVVALPANATTGYSWHLAAVGRKVLVPGASAYLEPKQVPKIVGAGGVAVLGFHAVARGRTTLRLAYVGPGRRPSVGKRFAVAVVVT